MEPIASTSVMDLVSNIVSFGRGRGVLRRATVKVFSHFNTGKLSNQTGVPGLPNKWQFFCWSVHRRKMLLTTNVRFWPVQLFYRFFHSFMSKVTVPRFLTVIWWFLVVIWCFPIKAYSLDVYVWILADVICSTSEIRITPGKCINGQRDNQPTRRVHLLNC